MKSKILAARAYTFCGLICVCVLLLSQCGIDRSQTVVLGCKNFTEQIILGEIIAQMIEQNTKLKVVRKWNLGGTMVCHQALLAGEIDLYPEYTGTAYMNVLGQNTIQDATRTFKFVQQKYLEEFQCEWLPAFGLNNTYTITVRREDAEKWNVKSISGLQSFAGELTAGFTAEFMERQDGWPQLREQYGLPFAKVVDLEPGLMYEAIANNNVDVICGFSTDGRISVYDLVALEDDLHFFPPYYAAPVARTAVFDLHPELKGLLSQLAGSLDNQTMQELNLQVDEHKVAPKSVAKEFLATMN
ncbi:MAG: glycine betaine ABC transporter substrate-binding protein [Candidatus Hinthialibacter antarcticus]|nr:glycine betaine ABC transporter substrate-binding protein [Candidatus Hinthialibacter antarcticus]